MDGIARNLIPNATLLTISFASIAAYLYFGVLTRAYGAYKGPLSRFPGPKLRALSRFPHIRTIYLGRDNIDFPALHRQYGEAVRFGPNELSFLGSQQVWKDIYGFAKGGQAQPYKDPEFYSRPESKAPGLMTADDATHSRQRKIVSHAFSDKAMNEQEPILKQWARKLMDRLSDYARTDVPIDMVKMLNCTTFDLMGDLVFAESLHMLDNAEYIPLVRAIFARIKYTTYIRALMMLSNVTRYTIEQLAFYIPGARRKAAERWKFIIDRVDRRIYATTDRPDIWTRILEKSKGSDGLSLQEQYSIASLFMVAGTETTGTALSGTLYYLLTNPQYLEKLQAELRNRFSSVEALTLEALQRDKYLNSVLNEGLRMFPPVPIGMPRIVPPGGATIGGRFVPENTKVMVHHMATYRAESNFKHAAQFRPERWMGDEEFKDDNLGAFEPFSVGPRNCLGKSLAWHEMRLLLATIVLHFDFKLCEESRDWADQKVYTLWDKQPLMCSIQVARP